MCFIVWEGLRGRESSKTSLIVLYKNTQRKLQQSVLFFCKRRLRTPRVHYVWVLIHIMARSVQTALAQNLEWLTREFGGTHNSGGKNIQNQSTSRKFESKDSPLSDRQWNSLHASCTWWLAPLCLTLYDRQWDSFHAYTQWLAPLCLTLHAQQLDEISAYLTYSLLKKPHLQPII